MSFIPFALPGAVPATINELGKVADNLTFNKDGTPKLPPYNYNSIFSISFYCCSTQSLILRVCNFIRTSRYVNMFYVIQILP